jgi:hypothetical protein
MTGLLVAEERRETINEGLIYHCSVWSVRGASRSKRCQLRLVAASEGLEKRSQDPVQSFTQNHVLVGPMPVWSEHSRSSDPSIRGPRRNSGIPGLFFAVSHSQVENKPKE